MFKDKGVMVKCRNCGHDTYSTELVLDPDYRMMVCPECVKEKRLKHEVKSELEKVKNKTHEIEIEEDKPAGWDHDDEYLNKASKRIEKETVSVQRVDKHKVRYTCPKCKYPFVYDIVNEKPARCPYCSDPIAKINVR